MPRTQAKSYVRISYHVRLQWLYTHLHKWQQFKGNSAKITSLLQCGSCSPHPTSWYHLYHFWQLLSFMCLRMQSNLLIVAAYTSNKQPYFNELKFVCPLSGNCQRQGHDLWRSMKACKVWEITTNFNSFSDETLCTESKLWWKKFPNFRHSAFVRGWITLTLCTECLNLIRNYVSRVQKHSLPNFNSLMHPEY